LDPTGSMSESLAVSQSHGMRRNENSTDKGTGSHCGGCPKRATRIIASCASHSVRERHSFDFVFANDYNAVRAVATRQDIPVVANGLQVKCWLIVIDPSLVISGSFLLRVLGARYERGYEGIWCYCATILEFAGSQLQL